MKGDPTPIRAGIVPTFDAERELIDYCASHIRDFCKDTGAPPTRIAFAVMGRAEDGAFTTKTHSWDMKGEAARIETCGLAASLFMQRALDV